MFKRRERWFTTHKACSLMKACNVIYIQLPIMCLKLVWWNFYLKRITILVKVRFFDGTFDGHNLSAFYPETFSSFSKRLSTSSCWAIFFPRHTFKYRTGNFHFTSLLCAITDRVKKWAVGSSQFVSNKKWPIEWSTVQKNPSLWSRNDDRL